MAGYWQRLNKLAIRVSFPRLIARVLKLGSWRLKIKLGSNGFAQSPNRRRATQKYFTIAPDACHRARQRISSCPDRIARGQKNFLRENSRLSRSQRERPRGRIVFWPARWRAGFGVERARAFLRRPSNGTRHVCRPRARGLRP